MDQSALVRCLIGVADEQEKQAVVGLLARGAMAAGRGLLKAPGAASRGVGRLVGRAAKATIPRAGRAVGAVAAPAARGGARAAGSVTGSVIKRLTGTGYGKKWKFSGGRTLMTGLVGLPVAAESIAAGRKAAVTPYTFRPGSQYYARSTRMG